MAQIIGRGLVFSSTEFVSTVPRSDFIPSDLMLVTKTQTDWVLQVSSENQGKLKWGCKEAPSFMTSTQLLSRDKEQTPYSLGSSSPIS